MKVDVQIASDSAGIPPGNRIRAWVRAAVSTAIPDSGGDVTVRVVDESEMRTLNREFRHKDEPTNVLSFPAGDADGLPPGVAAALGDIVVCAPVVAREAAEQDKAVVDHWGHMLVHGTLHLLGHDHVGTREARRMEALERSILATFGIADPYRGN